MSDSTSLIVLTKPNRVRTLTIPDDTAYVTQYMNAIFAMACCGNTVKLVVLLSILPVMSVHQT